MILLRKSRRYGVPTAAYGTFSDFEEAKAYNEEKDAPIVVKADGLALGKGVVVAEMVEQAVEAAHEMLLDNKFGDSGARVVIEEFSTEKSSLLLLSSVTSSVYANSSGPQTCLRWRYGPNIGGKGLCTSSTLAKSVVATAVDTAVASVLDG